MTFTPGDGLTSTHSGKAESSYQVCDRLHLFSSSLTYVHAREMHGPYTVYLRKFYSTVSLFTLE